jgi:molybdopterin molybdotransferase
VEPLSPSIVLSYTDAARTIHQHAASLNAETYATESIDLLNSLGRTLAAPVIADRDQPPFPRSTRDGFACRAADLAAPLLVVGQLRAGEIWTGPALEPGQTIEIMTGAPVPAGADCVLMVEHATTNDSYIRADRQLTVGENIVAAGSEARSGATLIPAGTRVGPPHIAAAAACGYAALPVYRRPRVGILATGDELVTIDSRPLLHQIRNSNSYSIAAQILAHGGQPVLFPIVRDDLATIEDAVAQALDPGPSGSDLLILSGGVSMGKYDFVEQALVNLRAEFFFTGVRIQPGRPAVFGRLPTSSTQGHRYFFGLPGNPVSTLVTFALFAAPLLSALSGQTGAEIGPRFAEASLATELSGKPGLTRFLPAYLESDASHASVHPIPWQGSGDQTAAARTNCFLVIPEDTADLPSSSQVSILLL